MIKYAQIIDKANKLCNVGLGNNIDFYKSIGMTKMEVEIAYNGQWYVQGYAPQTKPIDEQIKALDTQYNSDKAVLMSQYTEADIDEDNELKESIKAELVALREQYDKDYEEIVGSEE